MSGSATGKVDERYVQHLQSTGSVARGVAKALSEARDTFYQFLPHLVAAVVLIMASIFWWCYRASETAKKPRAPAAKTCTLKWASEHPCFCRPNIFMDLTKLTPSTHTIAAIFGSPHPAALIVRDASGQRIEVATLRIGGEYEVSLRSDAQAPDWVPIKQIARRLDEQTVQNMSASFYERVWADTDDSLFRAMFVGNAESPVAAADAQWRWLIEIWGGPKRYSEQFGDGTLITRMLAKHSDARMKFRLCERWLHHMLAAMEEAKLGADDPAVALSVRRYWLHFFGFFEVTVDERRELRALAGI